MYYPSYEYLQQLEARIQQLETEKKHLQEELRNIKPVQIDNINYKIQELTVQELSGTLNIGMTALSDPEEIQKWLNETEGGRETGEKTKAEESESNVDIQLHDVEQPEDSP